jgi:hypothetical protein
MVSPDTIVPDPTNPQSYNRYSYTFNNPLKYIDPSGHCVENYYSGSETDNYELYSICLDAWATLYDYYYSHPGQFPLEYLTARLQYGTLDSLVSELNGFGITYNYTYTPEETPTEIPRLNINLPDFDAFSVGGSGNVDLPWFIGAKSFVIGGEMVVNWESNDITFFFYYGGGTTAGAGANASGYLALIGNAPDNAAYSGPFVSVDGTGSLGPVGVVADRATAPQDFNPLDPPEEAYSYYLGYAPGANASLTVNQTEYIPLFSMSWDRRLPFSWGLPQ